MRIFTAFQLTNEILQYIQDIQEKLKLKISCKRWQKVENLHLTLHFMGEVEESHLDMIQTRIQAAVREFSSFSLQLENWGAFPNEVKPRVIWLGVGHHTAPLLQLQQSMNFLKEYGYKEEAYFPHITLGRNPTGKVPWEELRINVPVLPLECKVDKVVLYQSQLCPEGVKYVIVENFPFPKV